MMMNRISGVASATRTIISRNSSRASACGPAPSVLSLQQRRRPPLMQSSPHVLTRCFTDDSAAVAAAKTAPSSKEQRAPQPPQNSSNSGDGPSATSSSESPPAAPAPAAAEFKYEKSKHLYEKITSTCTKDDVRQISHAINRILGRTFHPNEFYYRGIGGGRGRGGGGKGAANASAAGGSEEEEEEVKAEEKLIFDIKLVAFDAKAKIKVIKEVRSIAGLGLKEAKEMVEGAPKVVMKDVKKEQAEEMKTKLEAVGGTVELA